MPGNRDFAKGIAVTIAFASRVRVARIGLKGRATLLLPQTTQFEAHLKLVRGKLDTILRICLGIEAYIYLR